MDAILHLAYLAGEDDIFEEGVDLRDVLRFVDRSSVQEAQFWPSQYVRNAKTSLSLGASSRRKIATRGKHTSPNH